MLSFFDFTNLPKEEQLCILFDSGKRIAQGNYQGINLTLYSLCDFFVELGVTTVQEEVHIAITTHTSRENMPYYTEHLGNREVA